VSIRETIFENFAADLEYNPPRAAAYITLGILSIAVWEFAQGIPAYSLVPPICGLGGIALIGKAIFMFRKQTAGFGTDQKSLVASSEPLTISASATSQPGRIEKTIPDRVAQFLEDFALGPLLLCPPIHFAAGFEGTEDVRVTWKVFLSGAIIFGAGWCLRRLTRQISVIQT